MKYLALLDMKYLAALDMKIHAPQAHFIAKQLHIPKEYFINPQGFTSLGARKGDRLMKYCRGNSFRNCHDLTALPS